MSNIISKLQRIGKDNYYRFTLLNHMGVYRFLSDERYIKKEYRLRMGKELNIENPKTYNEKLQWLKLYDRRPIYTTMVDKVEAKQYAASFIGEEHIIPTLGVWNHFDEIDFDLLPNQFVLKCTHDSGTTIICKDKNSFYKQSTRNLLEKWLARNFYWNGREWPYKNVKPRIIAEAYLEDSITHDLRDYKFWLFRGNGG